eukprot:TRINITY_DN63_c0_g1_i12.p1 TRINITY_DN63_c0_g1~~TRINITY_DN63_c0_g1_i12.p1  ORF type:complete len:367 (+),score=40.25 TRINITY_DN63_c0_g1_i12:56-1156(+)
MAYRYQGGSNEGLVNALEMEGLFTSPKIRSAFLSVPRGDFIPWEHNEEAYIDHPIRIESLGFNISAPHMYAVCLQNLDIQPGNSFLDVGCGCGLMTAIAGVLVGPNGVSHGIDVLNSSIESSKSNLANLKEKRGLDLKNVTYEKRNVFIPDLEARKWDRIHVGASCPHTEKHKLYELLKPGGILVTPIGSSLVLSKKDPFTGITKETRLLDVRYGELILPTTEEIAEAERLRSLQVVLPDSSISKDYKKMFNNKFLSDVSFLVEGQNLYAHKVVLASRCEYFASLYHVGMKDSLSNEIIINDYSHTAFRELLRFIYTDECQISGPQIAAELMSAAEFYGLNRLKALMEHILSKSLNIDTACAILGM